ncbi:MAG: linear amide C-N hydrolase, partial [Massilioclostridium sp.]|nr:linear amide C-N hydrolase [Massilioclostridium sp.]
MCTRFVYRGDDMITGFNFDIDLTVWDHKIVKEKDRFYIGILRPDGVRHSYHGVNRNGNVGTLLYVHGNSEGTHQDSKSCMTIADLTEWFIQATISFDDALRMVQEQKIVYAPDATMQAMLSDRQGRTLIIEPGIGWREDDGRYSLITNYSVLVPESTSSFIVPGDDRYERAA